MPSSMWHLVDARGQVVGRLASQLVHILRGKHKPTYAPHLKNVGDYVVVINAKYVHFTGDKYTDKNYTWHTGYPGGLKTRTVKEQMSTKPEEVLRKAVLGMLAKNNLRNVIGTRLRIFPGSKHLHEDRIPTGTKSILS